MPTLAPLASDADLLSRGSTSDDVAAAAQLLDIASSIVRGAAGRVPISRTTSTVTITVWGETQVQLPGAPIQSVSSVELDGSPVTDWTLTDTGALWRPGGWGCAHEPGTLEAVIVHGYATVPPRLVNLVCDLAMAGAAAVKTGPVDTRVLAERIDDYSVTFAQTTDAVSVASAMQLPRTTRAWLAAQFGGGAGTVRAR